MISLTNSIYFFSFSAVFDPLIHMKTILIKKNIYSEIILVAASGLSVNTRIPNDDRAWSYYLNDK